MTRIGPRTAREHEEPYAVQFSVFLANRVGRLKDLLELFEAQEVPLTGLSIVDSSDWAVIRLVSAQANRARELLGERGLPFTETRVLLVEVDETQSVSSVCRLLVAAEINIHFMYPLIVHPHQRPVLAMHVDDYIEARAVLTRHGLRLLGDEDLADRG